VKPCKKSFSCPVKLERELREVDEGTVIYPPSSADDLMLKSNGATRAHGNRYTVPAFNSVAQSIAPGLSLLIPNIAGINRRPRSSRESFSRKEAIRIFNAVVDLRFEDDLSLCQLVVNERDGHIEGLLGPKTQYLENLTLFQMIQDMLGDTADTEFCEGLVAGRHLMLRYTHTEELTTIEGEESDAFHYGYHFANSESGDASVRAAPLIYRALDGTGSLIHLKESGRQFHTGKDFAAKLSHLISSVLLTDTDNERLCASLLSMSEQTLDLDPETPGALKRQMESLEQSLRHDTKAVTNAMARNIVKHAVYVGSYGAEPDTDVEYLTHRNSVIRARTQFDVYNAITREAQRLAIPMREGVERTAHDYMVRTGAE
jgi:hypothetical protein